MGGGGWMAIESPVNLMCFSVETGENAHRHGENVLSGWSLHVLKLNLTEDLLAERQLIDKDW